MQFFRQSSVPFRYAICSGSAVIAIVASAWSTNALAQAATAPAATPTGVTADNALPAVGEIVVTAQRRAESLQSVPLAVQVTTGVELQQRHIVDTTELALITPTLTFTAGSAPANVSVALRGVASLANQPGVQPSTSLVVDDVPLVRQGEYVAKLSDIASIQILDGPQGTLFGKNSTAGVINIETVEPVNHVDAWVEGGATTDKEYSGRGMLNLPLTDKIQTRVNFYYDDQQSLVTNLDPVGNGLAGDKSYGFEAKLKYEVTPDLNILATGNYNHDKSSYDGEVPIAVSQYPNEVAVLGYTPHYGLALINQNIPNLAIVNSYSGTLRIGYDITKSFNFTSITSYHHFQAQSILDTDTTPVGSNVGIGYAPNPLNYFFQVPEYNLGVARFTDRVNYWSEEDRLNYESRWLKFVGGVFYQDVHGWDRNLSPSITGGNVTGTFRDNGVESAPYSDKTASIYGDATLHLTSTINVFAGLRYTREQTAVVYNGATYKNPVSFFNPVTGINSAPPVNAVTLYGGETVHNLSGRAGIQWQPTRDVNLYASYARGYKGQALGLAGSQTTNQFLNVNPEIASDFELGAKLRFLDRRLALDVSLFHETINDIQESTIVPGTILTELINAGDLYTKGVTASLDARITDHFNLSSGLAVLDASYGTFLFACSPHQTVGQGGCFLSSGGAAVQNLHGQQAIEAPRLKYNVSARYRNEVPGLRLDYVAELDWIWTDKVQYSLNEDPLTLAPSHGTLNLSVDFKTHDGHWDVLFYGKNLTNKFFYSNLVDVPTAFGLVGQLSRDFKVYGGATVRYHF